MDSSDPAPAYRSPNVTLALSYYEALDSQDNERLSTLLTETFETRGLPTGMINSIRSKSQFLASNLEQWSRIKRKGVKSVILDVIEAVDSRVIIHCRKSGTQGPKDTPFEFEAIQIFSFAPGPDGKPRINELRTFSDMLSHLADTKRAMHPDEVWDIARVRATLIPSSPGAPELKAKTPTPTPPQCAIM